jgi:hypothetical protein
MKLAMKLKMVSQALSKLTGGVLVQRKLMNLMTSCTDWDVVVTF